jgi:Ca2+/Na+ antiporter
MRLWHTRVMFGLYIALASLGLSAIDPIGIGIMPILLVQKRPYRRTFIFLSGSFVSLVIMGILFSKGLGNIVLRFEHQNNWFLPTIECLGGFILFVIATFLYIEFRKGKASVEPTGKLRQSLQFSNTRLFISGVLLVAVQSILDVVFVVAMVRIGQLHLSLPGLISAVVTYALAALVFQIVVVIAFRFAPAKRKAKTLDAVHRLLVKYANQALIVVSIVLGLILFILAVSSS